MGRLEIAFDKRRLGLLVGFCSLIMVIIGIVLYKILLSSFLMFFLCIVWVIMGGGMFFGINRWRKNEPAIIIDEDGIWDNSTALSIGKIKWGQIERIEYKHEFGIIMLVLRDPAYLLNKQHNLLVKSVLWLNWKLDTSPIHLNDKLITINAAELMKVLEERQQKELPFDDFSEHLVDE